MGEPFKTYTYQNTKPYIPELRKIAGHSHKGHSH